MGGWGGGTVLSGISCLHSIIFWKAPIVPSALSITPSLLSSAILNNLWDNKSTHGRACCCRRRPPKIKKNKKIPMNNSQPSAVAQRCE